MSDLFGMITKSEDYKRKVHEQNQINGVYRSGEGTEQEVLERRREVKEREYLESLTEKNEYTYDSALNAKLHKIFIQNFK